MQIEESNLEKQVLRLECMQRDFQKKALVYQEIERYWRRCAFFVACILGLLPVLAGVTQLLPKELSPWMTLCISITNVCVVVMNVKMDMGERIADAAMAAKCFGGLATQVSFFLFTVECQPYKADATALLSQIRAVVECVETNMTYPEGLTYEVRMDARSPSSSAQLSPLFLSPASPSASPDAAGHRQLQPWGEPAPGPAEEGAMNPMHPLHEVLASAMRPGLYYAEDRGPPHLQEPWHEPPAAETQQQPGRKARQGRGAGGEGEVACEAVAAVAESPTAVVLNEERSRMARLASMFRRVTTYLGSLRPKVGEARRQIGGARHQLCSRGGSSHSTATRIPSTQYPAWRGRSRRGVAPKIMWTLDIPCQLSLRMDRGAQEPSHMQMKKGRTSRTASNSSAKRPLCPRQPPRRRAPLTKCLRCSRVAALSRRPPCSRRSWSAQCRLRRPVVMMHRF
eukprot:TRINITY_DN7671_c0_g1_i5.p1 TRINITY_DN7671_c0_g1~~TRINITY_DN7671_c0_g1_i5.p1  ORF type:complete len:454 (+),score=77.42 TRINITY_DN7671_c0_g1_i5:82-1443(+)